MLVGTAPPGWARSRKHCNTSSSGGAAPSSATADSAGPGTMPAAGAPKGGGGGGDSSDPGAETPGRELSAWVWPAGRNRRLIKHGAYGVTHLLLALISLAAMNALMIFDKAEWRASWVCGMLAPLALAISAFAFRVPVKQPAPAATDGKRLDIINTKFRLTVSMMIVRICLCFFITLAERGSGGAGVLTPGGDGDGDGGGGGGGL
eukprot:SAG22_NODE_4740_length_1178_cov_1.334569_1_plen_205_part_00